jgi:hypothetical protein
MNSERTVSLITGLCKVSLYVLFGLFVFVVTFLFLFRKSYANGSVGYVAISEKDSCYLEFPDEFRNSKDGVILLYVATKPCAICSESIIMNMVNSLNEAGLTVEPTMLYHPLEVSDSSQIETYFDKFARHVNLVVSYEDSIMIKNPWMQEGFGFYGIVTDSTDMVKFAGSFLDPGFLACCNKEFGKKNILNGAEP